MSGYSSFETEEAVSSEESTPNDSGVPISKTVRARVIQSMRRAREGVSNAVQRVRNTHGRVTEFIDNQVTGLANGSALIQFERWMLRMTEVFDD